MRLEFTKMHGCGNDYIYFNCLSGEIENPEKLARKLSDRHFGVGGDGIVLICASGVADAKMRMFNADGSEGKMCGNATRCIGKYLYDNRIVTKKNITLETLSGIKKLTLMTGKNDKVKSVRVFMGKAEMSPALIPTTIQGREAVAKPLSVGGREYAVTCVSMGNPHCVVFVDKRFNLKKFDLAATGALFEHHAAFPEGINTEFVKLIGDNRLSMRVWERGSGETLACGTGACAVAVAAVKNKLCDSSRPIRVDLVGGTLTIEVTRGGVYMTGPAEKVFDGAVEL